MVERPQSTTIRKKTTSRIAFIGLAAATMMIAVSIVGAIQLQEASAAKPQFCYSIFGFPSCYETMQQCRFFQQLDEQAGNPTGPCRPQQPS